MKNLITLLSLALCLVFANTAFAVVGPAAPVATDNTEVARELTKQELRQQKKMQRMQKRIQKMQDKNQGVDFSDDTQKWMWFWIFGWVAGIVLTVLASALFIGSAFSGGFGIAAILYLVAYLAYLFGTISLIIWLIKKFS